jgi:molecular chaperone GrpE (heat shock protein)
MRNRLVLWLVLLVAGFLAGFIPQYLKAQRGRAELSNAQQQLTSCRAETQLSKLRDTAAMMYLEAIRKNYGIAQEHSQHFFDQVQQATAQTADPAVKKTLDDILKLRDPITAALAKGDPAVLSDLQSVLTNIQTGTRR